MSNSVNVSLSPEQVAELLREIASYDTTDERTRVALAIAWLRELERKQWAR